MLSRVTLVFALLLGQSAIVPAAEPFEVTPSDLALVGNFAQAQLLVSGSVSPNAINSAIDLTHQVAYSSSDDAIATVSSIGQVIPRGNGAAQVTISFGGFSKSVPVNVSGIVDEPAVDFLEQIRPALYKAGCNMGACHAAQHGQGGFKLSVFGFDPEADFAAIAREELSRRINRIEIGRAHV